MVAVTTVDWSDIAPPETRPDEAIRQLRYWHGRGAGSRGRMVLWNYPLRWSLYLRLDEAIQRIQDHGLDGLVYYAGEQNVYFSVGTQPDMVAPRWIRGGRDTVVDVPGAVCDLDVKRGAFESGEQIAGVREALAGLGLAPGMRVGTGENLAQHWYWPVEGGCSPSEAEELSARMRLLIMKLAGGIELDRVGNADRVLRLAGTLRVPKRGEGRGLEAVRLLEVVEGGQGLLDPAVLRGHTEELALAEEWQATRYRGDWDGVRLSPADLDNPWLVAMAEAEITGALDRLADAGRGTDRSRRLFAVAADLFGWTQMGLIGVEDLRTELLGAARVNGSLEAYGEKEISRQIQNGFNAVGARPPADEEKD